MKKRNMMKKFAALMMAAIMVMAMGITSMASTVYPKFCKDGTTTISMAQKAVASEATITGDARTGYTAKFKVQSFTATKGGFSGTGSVEYITVGSTNYYPDSNSYISIPVSASNYEVDSTTKYTDVSIKVSIDLISGTISVPLTQSADLYFSSTLATYTE